MPSEAKWVNLFHWDFLDANEQERLTETHVVKADAVCMYWGLPFSFLLHEKEKPLYRRLLEMLRGKFLYVFWEANVPYQRDERIRTGYETLRLLSEMVREGYFEGVIVGHFPERHMFEFRKSKELSYLKFFEKIPCQPWTFIIPRSFRKSAYFSSYTLGYVESHDFIEHLRLNYPSFVVDAKNFQPSLKFVTIVSRSLLYVQLLPAGGMRSFFSAIYHHVPFAAYFPNMETAGYFLEIISRGDKSTAWKKFTVTDQKEEIIQTLNRFLSDPEVMYWRTFSDLQLFYKQFADLIELRPLWERWVAEMPIYPPRELVPFFHVYPHWIDDPEVILEQFPRGEWDKLEFSLNLEKVRASLEAKGR